MDKLDYKHSPLGSNTGNNCNGKPYKTIMTDEGEIELLQFLGRTLCSAQRVKSHIKKPV